MMRLVLRGLGLAVPLLFFHVACGGDDDSGPAPTPDAGEDATIEPTEDSSVPPADTGPVKVVNDTNETLTVDGQQRKYVLSVPVDYDATKKYPLVLSFHGDGGSGPGQRKAFPFEVSSGKDAIIAYPTGIDTSWDLYVAVDDNKDYKFVNALIDALAGKYSIDKKKVLGFGYSKGAFFINQVACKFPGLFKAISSHEGGAPSDDSNGSSRTCTNAKVAAFVFHGTKDSTVTPDSGDYDAKFWAKQNGCPSFDPDQRVDADPSPCKKTPDCSAATPSYFCLIPGLNHYVWDRGVEVTWKFWNALP